MKAYRVYIIPLLVFSQLIITSCNKNEGQKLVASDKAVSFSKFENTKPLSLNKLGTIDTYSPWYLLPVDSIILIYSDKTEYQVKIFSIAKGEVIGERLKNGAGPGEAQGIFSTGIVGDSIWFYDITLSLLIKYKWDDFLKTDTAASKRFKIGHSFYSTSMLNDSILVGAGLESAPNKFHFYNIYTGHLKGSPQEYEIPPNIPLGTAKDALRCYVNLRSNKDNLMGDIALVGRYTDVVEIFDRDDRAYQKSIHGPDHFDPVFNIGKRSDYTYMSKKSDTRKAYVKSLSTNNYIYALYSGSLRSDRSGWSFGKNIHVFDWNGNPMFRYELKDYIYTYAVDKNDQRMYIYFENDNSLNYAELEMVK